MIKKQLGTAALGVCLLLAGCATSQAVIQNRQEVINKHPEWSKEKKSEVLDGSIYLGMTKEEITSIWNTPGSCSKTTTLFGVSETCSYEGGHMYIFYQDGVATSWNRS